MCTFAALLRRIDNTVTALEEWAWRRWAINRHGSPVRCSEGWHIVGPTGLCTKCGEEP